MYIDVDENITEMQDGPSLAIDGPPIIATKIHFCTLRPIWLLILLVVIFVLVVHVSALYPDPESLVPIEST